MHVIFYFADIDECIDLELCEGMCENLLGSYSCTCPAGYEGDGMKGGEGCHSKRKYSGSTFFYIASGNFHRLCTENLHSLVYVRCLVYSDQENRF